LGEHRLKFQREKTSKKKNSKNESKPEDFEINGGGEGIIAMAVGNKRQPFGQHRRLGERRRGNSHQEKLNENGRGYEMEEKNCCVLWEEAPYRQQPQFGDH